MSNLFEDRMRSAAERGTSGLVEFLVNEVRQLHAKVAQLKAVNTENAKIFNAHRHFGSVRPGDGEYYDDHVETGGPCSHTTWGSEHPLRMKDVLKIPAQIVLTSGEPLEVDTPHQESESKYPTFWLDKIVRGSYNNSNSIKHSKEKKSKKRRGKK